MGIIFTWIFILSKEPGDVKGKVSDLREFLENPAFLRKYPAFFLPKAPGNRLFPPGLSVLKIVIKKPPGWREPGRFYQVSGMLLFRKEIRDSAES